MPSFMLLAASSLKLQTHVFQYLIDRSTLPNHFKLSMSKTQRTEQEQRKVITKRGHGLERELSADGKG